MLDHFQQIGTGLLLVLLGPNGTDQFGRFDVAIQVEFKDRQLSGYLHRMEGQDPVVLLSTRYVPFDRRRVLSKCEFDVPLGIVFHLDNENLKMFMLKVSFQQLSPTFP